ncbi:hypothetical protein MMU07_11985 [Aquiflexum sp. LQ15W]|uniref:hypothetical protein n=1 Tax=Cognataquiflexum nitidum TaxID=2922272 RepID=UPI001F13A613|nr:hypothetical protein [Cognataquiflexum nitidum]MCH6200302.1 hypothetical protein [Cognataquiflexum nitidum]
MLRDNFKFVLVLSFALSAAITGCNNKKRESEFREIVLPKNLEFIEIDKSQKFDKSWFDRKIKVVVFAKHADTNSPFKLDWQSAISEFEDIAFLFYVSEKDTAKLISNLKKVNFTHPIIHDPSDEFRELNVKEKEWTFISYLVKDNEIVGMGNPSLPDFKEKLSELKNESK